MVIVVINLITNIRIQIAMTNLGILATKMSKEANIHIIITNKVIIKNQNQLELIQY
jgi:hypothetical protein